MFIVFSRQLPISCRESFLIRSFLLSDALIGFPCRMKFFLCTYHNKHGESTTSCAAQDLGPQLLSNVGHPAMFDPGRSSRTPAALVYQAHKIFHGPRAPLCVFVFQGVNRLPVF
jgi:hypothetical protein